MKKLSKLKLKDSTHMSEDEMKMIVGGGYPKQDVCVGKKYAESCSWTYEGSTYYGKCCGSFMGSPVHCTDLNCYN